MRSLFGQRSTLTVIPDFPLPFRAILGSPRLLEKIISSFYFFEITFRRSNVIFILTIWWQKFQNTFWRNSRSRYTTRSTVTKNLNLDNGHSSKKLPKKVVPDDRLAEKLAQNLTHDENVVTLQLFLLLI